jgi:hypothetical protein
MEDTQAMTERTDHSASWTFLTNHAHVLICLKKEPGLTLRDVSLRVGITERAVQRIVADLEEEGYLVREREGRRNTYQLNLNRPLRHNVEHPCTIGDLVELILTRKPLAATPGAGYAEQDASPVQ